jgi:putative transposase
MKLKHYDHDGRERFVTFCTHKRIAVLTNTAFRKIIVECLEDVRRSYDLHLLGYVIMPEHVHLVVVPPKDIELGTVIGKLKRLSAKRIHDLLRANNGDLVHRLTVMRNGRQRFALWQRRCFDHNCRSDESVWEKVEYCHNNPVTRDLVAKQEDWKWSSCRWYLRKQDAVLRMDAVIAE